MSDTRTALGGASFDGTVQVAEAPLQGMITLRGDLGDARVRDCAADVCSTRMPDRGEMHCSGARGLGWMSPDELLLLCPYAQVPDTLAQIRASLAGLHMLAVNVSDARAMFTLHGAQARTVLAKLAPVDLAAGRFEAPMFRRTRLAQAPAAFWMPDAERFAIVCFRSQARYVFDLLCAASKPGASPVKLP